MCNKRLIDWVVIVPLLAIIAAPGLIQTAFEVRNRERPGVFEVFDRAPTARNLHDFERDLERSSLVLRVLRPWVQYGRFRLLADPGEKAVAGRDGWLFYEPGVRFVVERRSEPWQPGRAAIDAIRAFRDELQARGIVLYVVPVPGKESVYPDQLAWRATDAGVIVPARTAWLFDELRRHGIAAIDLFTVFRQLRGGRVHASPLYLAQDTHWSPQGAQLAAHAVAERILRSGAIALGNRRYRARTAAVDRVGDLVLMLQSPAIEAFVSPERVLCRQVLEPDSDVPYHDEPAAEVLVLGDSFLRIYERDEPGSAGFLAQLASELQAPVASIVNDGGGATLVRQELARRPNLLKNKRVVIWEFAERDLRDALDGWHIVSLDRSNSIPR